MSEVAIAGHEHKISTALPEHLHYLFGHLAITHTADGREFYYLKDERGRKTKRLSNSEIPWQELDNVLEEAYGHDIGAREEYNRAWAEMSTPDGTPALTWQQWEEEFLEAYRHEHPIVGIKIESPLDDLTQENRRLREELAEKERENLRLNRELEEMRQEMEEMRTAQSEMSGKISTLERRLREREGAPTGPVRIAPARKANESPVIQEEPEKIPDVEGEFYALKEDLQPAFGEEKLVTLAERSVERHDEWQEDIDSAVTEEEGERRRRVAEEELEHIYDAITRHEISLLNEEQEAELPPEPEAKLKRYLKLAPEVFEIENGKHHHHNHQIDGLKERARRAVESIKPSRSERPPRFATVTLPDGRRVRVMEEYIVYDEDDRQRNVLLGAAIGGAALLGAAVTAAIIYASHKSGTSPDVLQAQINTLNTKLSSATHQLDVLRGQHNTELAREKMESRLLVQNHSLIESLKGQINGLSVQVQDIRERLRGTAAGRIFEFSRYRYPWDWAKQVAPRNPEGYLHVLGDRASRHGHRVVWIKEGFLSNGNLKEVLKVDGTTNTQKVLQIISQYR